LQPGGDRLAHVVGQREPIELRSFAEDHKLAGAPVDVLEAECGDLSGAKAEARQHHEHGEVAPSVGGAPIAALEQGFHRVGVK
jgi:hypothetical protein